MLTPQVFAALALTLLVHGLDITITSNKTIEIPSTLGGGYMWEVRDYSYLAICLPTHVQDINNR
jgi:hypothetical protein